MNNEIIKTYLTSNPAMTATAVVIIAIVLMFKFSKQIGRKIKDVTSVGGDKGANWTKGKGKLPTSGYDKIREEFKKANNTILGLRSQNDDLIKIAQSLNQELEDTKLMVFFERLLRSMVNWQYFLLKVGCEGKNRQLTLEEAKNKITEAYPDFNQYVNDDAVVATLEDLQNLGLMKAIRPYTNDTPLEFTEFCASFLAYVNT